MTNSIKHPQYGLPISQCAYMAELLSTSPVAESEIYLEMKKLWPDMKTTHFNTLILRLKESINLVRKDRNISISGKTLERLRSNIKLERSRVLTLIRSGKPGIIELKPIK